MLVMKTIHPPEEKNVILSIGFAYGNMAELNLWPVRLCRQDLKKQVCRIAF